MEIDYSRHPHDKAELMAWIKREWDALQNDIAPLREEQMAVPDAGGWSIKDNLAHLAAWEDFLRLYHLGEMSPEDALQIDAESYKTGDNDVMNEAIFDRIKEHTPAQAVAALQRSHAELLVRLDQLSFEDLLRPRFPDDPEDRPVLAWVEGNTYEHYQEHRAAIEKLIAQTKQAAS